MILEVSSTKNGTSNNNKKPGTTRNVSILNDLLLNQQNQHINPQGKDNLTRTKNGASKGHLKYDQYNNSQIRSPFKQKAQSSHLTNNYSHIPYKNNRIDFEQSSHNGLSSNILSTQHDILNFGSEINNQRDRNFQNSNANQNYKHRNSFNNLTNPINQHSLGVILSEEGEENTKTQARKSTYRYSKKDENHQVLDNKFQNQILDELRKQVSNLKKQVNSFQSTKLQNSQFKKQVILEEKVNQEEKYKKLYDQKQQLYHQFMNKIKGIREEHRQQLNRTLSESKEMHQHELQKREQMYNWRMNQQVLAYEDQIQRYKKTLQVYSQTLNNQANSTASNFYQISAENNKSIQQKDDCRSCGKCQLLMNQQQRQFSQQYSKLINENLEELKNIQKQKVKIRQLEHHLQKQRIVFTRNNSQQQQKLEEQFQGKEQYLKKMITQLKLKEQQLEMDRQKMQKQNLKQLEYISKIKYTLQEEWSKLRNQKLRLVEMESQLINKINVVQLYSNKQNKMKFNNQYNFNQMEKHQVLNIYPESLQKQNKQQVKVQISSNFKKIPPRSTKSIKSMKNLWKNI